MECAILVIYEAAEKVVANKGSAGVDGVTVDRLTELLNTHRTVIC